jgi:hypothetical protein
MTQSIDHLPNSTPAEQIAAGVKEVLIHPTPPAVCDAIQRAGGSFGLVNTFDPMVLLKRGEL